jgi:hypothetical protein
VLVNTDPQKRTFRRIAAEDLFVPLAMSASTFGIDSFASTGAGVARRTTARPGDGLADTSG